MLPSYRDGHYPLREKETKNKNAEAMYVKCNAKDKNVFFCVFSLCIISIFSVQFFGIFRKKVLNAKEKSNEKRAKPKVVKDPNQPKRPPAVVFVYLYSFPLPSIVQFSLLSDSSIVATLF